MSLPSLRLDTLTWEDLRQLAMRRIPAASGGRWTHHAPVDAGVTLLELLAFLLEQQVFMLDQVPDSLVRATLSLLGEEPSQTQIARTVMRFTALDDLPAAAPLPAVPAGTVLRPPTPELSQIGFTTTTGVWPLRLQRPPGAATGIGLRVDGVDRSADLAQGRPVELMPRLGREGRVDIDLHLAQPLPAGFSSESIGLLFELAALADIAPEWAAEAVDVPPPANLEWLDLTVGSRVLPATAVRDGTGGLRRSGLLRIPVQDDWAGATRIRIAIRCEVARFAASPRLLRLVPNAAIAAHRVPVAILGKTPDGSALDPARAEIAHQLAAWLPHSDLALALPGALGDALEANLNLRLLDRNGQWQDWRPRNNLGFARATDRVFSFDRSQGRLLFGNGYQGRVPAPAGDFELRLEVGGGSDGNLGPDGAWGAPIGSPIASAYAVDNVVAASGGGPAEAVAEARDRVAESLNRRHRAVTADDYVTMVQTTAGVGAHRAHVAAGHHPGFPCSYVPDAVTVFVVPRVDREAARADPAAELQVIAPVADPGALTRFRERLETARLIGSRVFVRTPRYHDVSLRVDVSSRVPRPAVIAHPVRRALARYLDPVMGGFERSGWPFGHPLRPSELVRVAQAALGDKGTVETVAIGVDGAAPDQACSDVAIGPHDLVYLASFHMRVQADQGARGDL